MDTNNAAAPIPPEPTTDGDWWFDDPATPTADGANGESAKPPASLRNWFLGGVGAVVIAGAAIVGINAATSSSTVTSAVAGASNNTNDGGFPGGSPGGFRDGGATIGTIASVNGTTLTVAAMTGPPGQTTAGAPSGSSTVKITTTDATTVTKSVTATLSELKVGDRIRAVGTGSTTALVATSVTDEGTVATTGDAVGGLGGPGGPGGPGGFGDLNRVIVSGTVTAIDGKKITVKTTDTTATVTTSSGTTFSKNETVAVSDLAVGDIAVVRGTKTNGTAAATSIRAGDFGGGFGPGGAAPGRTGSTN